MDSFANETNQSWTNITSNATEPVIYALGPPLATICSVCILIGTLFSLLCLYRYFRREYLRSYYTYLFHSMLIYCLISSFVNVPIFLLGYYLLWFDKSPQLCLYYSINALSISIGMLTSLAYASVERNYFIFRKNAPLTWRRQVIPIGCLMLYSYILAIVLVFAPRCDYVPCSPCLTRQWQAMVPALLFTFFLPELVMFTSTVVLIVRLYRQRLRLVRRQERHLFYRIVIQMSLYVVWSCLYYCPPAFYNLTLLLHLNLSSPSTQSAMMILSTVSVQSYPVLTFLLMCDFHRRTKRRHQRQPTPRPIVFSTITDPAIF